MAQPAASLHPIDPAGQGELRLMMAEESSIQGPHSTASDLAQEHQPTWKKASSSTTSTSSKPIPVNGTLRIQTHGLDSSLPRNYPQKDAFTERSSPILASLPLPPPASSSLAPKSKEDSSSSTSSRHHRWSTSIAPWLRNWSQVAKDSSPQPQPQSNSQPPRLFASNELLQDQQRQEAAAAEEAPVQIINRHYRPPRPPSDTRLQHRTSGRTKQSKSKKTKKPKNDNNSSSDKQLRKHSKSKKGGNSRKPQSKKAATTVETGDSSPSPVSNRFFQRLYSALTRIFTRRRRSQRPSRRRSSSSPVVDIVNHERAALTVSAAAAATAARKHPQQAVYHSPISPTQNQEFPETSAEPTSQPHSAPATTLPAPAKVPPVPALVSSSSSVSTKDCLFNLPHSTNDSILSYLEVSSSTTSLSDHLYPSGSTPPPSLHHSDKGKTRHQDNPPPPFVIPHPPIENQERSLPSIPPPSPPRTPTPPPLAKNTNSITSKMMKIIDKIKNHHHHHGDNGSPDAAQQMPVEKPSKPAGPRLHPDLVAMYDIGDKVLGVGTFATVKEIRCKETGKKFALKIILRKSLQGKGTMLETEISVLSKVRHPNCVSLLEMFETEDAVYLVTDLAEGGELFEQLLQKGYYTEGDAARLVRDVLLGVDYLHSMDIVHRDLKPENLLFKDKSENATLMITDFGLSKVLTGDNHVLMTACGTPGYVAPEVLQQTGHGKPVDMWSIGVIAYTLLVGFMPFYGEDQGALFEAIIAGEYEYEEEYWEHISPLAKAFIDSLLVTDPEQRPTASRALDHPWFRAVLEQDMVTPVSPADSVNLLPGIRKNFNARKMFKKAVRAVGILRKIHGAGSASSFESGTSSSSRVSGEFVEEATAATSRSSSRPHSLNAALSFHDVVQAVSLAHKGLAGVTEHDDEGTTEIMNKLSIKDTQ